MAVSGYHQNHQNDAVLHFFFIFYFYNSKLKENKIKKIQKNQAEAQPYCLDVLSSSSPPSSSSSSSEPSLSNLFLFARTSTFPPSSSSSFSSISSSSLSFSSSSKSLASSSSSARATSLTRHSVPRSFYRSVHKCHRKFTQKKSKHRKYKPRTEQKGKTENIYQSRGGQQHKPTNI